MYNVEPPENSIVTPLFTPTNPSNFEKNASPEKVLFPVNVLFPVSDAPPPATIESICVCTLLVIVDK